jgi:hypothetical protein
MMHRRYTAVLAGWLMVGCLVSVGYGETVVHTTTVPAGVPGDFKLRDDFLYLELENASQATSATNNDPGKTVFSSLQSDNWWGTASPDGALGANRGSGNQSSLSASIYWVDLPAPQAGQWDVYLRHALSSTLNDTTTLKSVTNTFYVGTGYNNSNSQQPLTGQTLVGSATISSYSEAPKIVQWDYLGRIALDGSTLDTFRLKLDSVYSCQQGDTVLMIRLPEPTAALSLVIGVLGLGFWRGRRHAVG